jgi:hypothetical protein
MDESGPEYKPTGSAPQLIAKEMNNEVDTKISDNSGCDRSGRMCDDASRPKRYGDSGARQAL